MPPRSATLFLFSVLASACGGAGGDGGPVDELCTFDVPPPIEWGPQGYILRRIPRDELPAGQYPAYVPLARDPAAQPTLPDGIYAPLYGLYDDIFPSAELAAEGLADPGFPRDEFYRTYVRKTAEVLEIVHEEFEDVTPPDEIVRQYGLLGRHTSAYALEVADDRRSYTLTQRCGEAPVASLADVAGAMQISVDPACKAHWRLDYADGMRTTGGEFVQAFGTIADCEPLPPPP